MTPIPDGDLSSNIARPGEPFPVGWFDHPFLDVLPASDFHGPLPKPDHRFGEEALHILLDVPEQFEDG